MNLLYQNTQHFYWHACSVGLSLAPLWHCVNHLIMSHQLSLLRQLSWDLLCVLWVSSKTQGPCSAFLTLQCALLSVYVGRDEINIDPHENTVKHKTHPYPLGLYSVSRKSHLIAHNGPSLLRQLLYVCELFDGRMNNAIRGFSSTFFLTSSPFYIHYSSVWWFNHFLRN